MTPEHDDEEHWRKKGEQSENHEWCDECGRSYFAHFDECPHHTRRALYAFEELPFRYVVKCSDDRVAPNPEQSAGVSRHRFYNVAREKAREKTRTEDLAFGVWSIELDVFVTGRAADEFTRSDFGCPVCGDEYDTRREGELVTYNHEEPNPDWNSDDPLSRPTRVRACEISCEDDPWAPDDWEQHLEEQREIDARVRQEQANIEAHLRNRGY